MAVSTLVINEMRSAIRFQLQASQVDIPNTDTNKFSDALAKGIAKGLTRWERELTDELRRVWKRDIDTTIQQKMRTR